MSAVQSSFNSNRYWSRQENYFSGADRSHVPANQFLGLMPVESIRDPKNHRNPAPAAVTGARLHEDMLMILFLAFFFTYAACRVML